MSVSLPQPSGSAKIYATAKKDWVIPPRAKPGRKPKAAPQDDADYNQNDPSDGNKKSQNRSAQKAFRERKQSQFSELQAKLQQYEQGEIERSVVLQNLGKRLKEENDQLRVENAELKAQVEQLTERLVAMSTLSAETSAVVDPSPVAITVQRGRGAKRERNESVPPAGLRAKRMKTMDMPQLQMPSADSPSNSSTPPQHILSPLSYNSSGGGVELYDNDSDQYMSPNIVDDGAASQFRSCGMCTSSVDCLCRQLGLGDPNSISQMISNDNDPLSILDNSPSVQLPARPKAVASLAAGLAGITLQKDTKESRPGCSGDPSNCKACADNAFGRAFCSALGSSACTSSSCTTCRPTPSSSNPDAPVLGNSGSTASLSINPSLLQCCGNPSHCHRDDCSSINAQSAKKDPTISHRGIHTSKAQDKNSEAQEHASVSCDVVWKTLEAHPNAHLANPTLGPTHLANLNLLAEVVARNSRCTLAPGETEIAPEDFPARRRSTQPTNNRSNGDSERDGRSAARVQIGYEDDPVARSSERTMVPRDVLQGHRRVITVQREGIRDAIALLDRQFGCS